MAGARPDTWMPLYIGDYLADTMHLNHAQHGVYLLLIMAYWRSGGPLVDDNGQLAAIAKCSGPEWRRYRPIIAPFFRVHHGAWFHKRIDAELEGAISKTEERSKAGAEGARRRWQTDGKNDGKAIAEPLANASQNDAPSPSPSPSPSPKGEAKREEPRSKPSESEAAREGLQNGSALGRCAPLETDPPTEAERAEAVALADRAIAALNGSVPKGVRDATAHAAAVKQSKFHRLVVACNGWVGERLDSAERIAAWEALAVAESAGSRAAMTPEQRRDFDAVVTRWRSTGEGI